MNKIFAVGFSMFILLFFYGMFGLAFWLGTSRELRAQLFTKKRMLWFGLGCLVLVAICAFIVAQNQFVYFWDYGGYWTLSYEYKDNLFSDPSAAINSLYSSINTREYNLLLPSIIALPLKILGSTFKRYVMINVFMFLIPLMMVLVTLMAKIYLQKNKKLSNKAFVAILLVVFTFVPLLNALVGGYIDIACLLPASLLLLLAVDFNATKFDRRDMHRNILMGVLLVLCVIFRRYFAFFVVGYVASLMIVNFCELWRKRKEKNFKKAFWNYCINFGIMGLTAISIFVILFSPLLITMLTNNYSEAYSAYDRTWDKKIFGVLDRIGLIFVIPAVVGAVVGLKSKKYKKITLIYLLGIIITMVAFFRIQAMGAHQIYIILIGIIVLVFLGVIYFVEKKPKLTFAIYSVMMGINIIFYLFIPTVSYYIGPISVSSTAPEKFYRSDIEELHNLADYVNRQNQNNYPVYVLASGTVLNSDIMYSLNKPDKIGALNGQVATADVDLRDGFAPAFLDAIFVITTDEPQTHLAEGSQDVITFLHAAIIDSGTPVGKHFEKLEEEFDLEKGVKVYVYKKTSEFAYDDLQYIADYFSEKYPGKEELFSDRILMK